MFSVFTNAWKVKDIRSKMLFIFFILAVYRLGTHIPLPGINPATLASAQAGASTGTLFSLIAGGGRASIFALGIGPYITASIIMQLLTVAITPLERLQKEGEEGRKKINQFTRVLAVVLAALQGIGTVYSLQSMFTYTGIVPYVVATLSLVTGTIVVMWLGELITERGLGNGSSFIIFANIIANLPYGISYLWNLASSGSGMDVLKVILIIIMFFVIIMFVVLVQNGERRIPVQYSKGAGGKNYYAGKDQYIPLKVNIAGVMSIIFAISLLQMPAVLNQLFQNDTLAKLEQVLSITSPSGLIIYVILIFCFTFFYTSFAINPIEMAENMKKNASFIPGIRPGKPTSDYIQTSVNRLSWIGASFYAIIAATPVLLDWIFNINVGFGGTTLLIVTGVALELDKQLESQLLMRHYKGFLS